MARERKWKGALFRTAAGSPPLLLYTICLDADGGWHGWSRHRVLGRRLRSEGVGNSTWLHTSWGQNIPVLNTHSLGMTEHNVENKALHKQQRIPGKFHFGINWYIILTERVFWIINHDGLSIVKKTQENCWWASLYEEEVGRKLFWRLCQPCWLRLQMLSWYRMLGIY